MRYLCLFALLLPAPAAPAPPLEIATGKMLGPGRDPRSFYVRRGSQPWQKTYTGPQYRPEAAGRLMNLRIGQALYHDEWLTEVPFDPEANTRRVVAALDSYKAHGVVAINVSLQGANMAYELTDNIRRDRKMKLGPGKGSLVSAFRPDGSLKAAWMRRTLLVARELDRRGMILNLLYFYAYQDEALAGPEAILAAVRNATDWIIDNNLRNVMIEIANEHDGGDYDHGRYIDKEMGRLIELARARFREKKAGWVPPISASTLGGMRVTDAVREHGDLLAMHGNNRKPEDKARRTRELAADPAMPGPVYFNEDNNGRDTTPENLALELASCDAVFDNGGSWGYMPWRQAQIFPFRHYAPGPSPVVKFEMPVEARDPAYFKAVLEHIRKRVLR